MEEIRQLFTQGNQTPLIGAAEGVQATGGLGTQIDQRISALEGVNSSGLDHPFVSAA